MASEEHLIIEFSFDAKEVGYLQCNFDLQDVLIGMITAGTLSRDQVEQITICMERKMASRNYSMHEEIKKL